MRTVAAWASNGEKCQRLTFHILAVLGMLCDKIVACRDRK